MKRVMSFLLAVILVGGCFGPSVIAETIIEGPVTVTGIPVTGWTGQTPYENTFRLPENDKTFILLEAGSDGFYVLSGESYGSAFFDTALGAGEKYHEIKNPYNGQRFDPNVNTNIAWWLNNEFLEKGNAENGLVFQLPKELLTWIDYSHIWRTECGDDYSNCSQSLCGGEKYYDTVAGITLMSYYEFNQYAGKFGVLDETGNRKKGGNKSGWWLRTCNRDGETVMRHMNTNPGVVGVWLNGGKTKDRKLGVRPQFYLRPEFFKNVKIDPWRIGKNVKKAIASSCTESDLRKIGYTEMEISQILDVSIDSDNEICLEDNFGAVGIGEPPVLRLKIGTAFPEGASYRIRWQIKGAEAQEISLFAKQGERIYRNCPFQMDEEGTAEAEIQVWRNNDLAASFSENIAYIRPGKKGGYDFLNKGVATHYSFGNTEKRDMDFLKSANMRVVRDEILWKDVERIKGKYDFTYYDVYLSELAAKNMDFVAILGYENPLYCVGAPTTDESIRAFSEYAAAVAENYPQIEAFEIWNEPDLETFWKRPPSAQEYINLVRGVSKAVKSVRPDAVLYGGVTTCGNPAYMQELIDLGLYAYVDGISFHPYVQPQRADGGKYHALVSGFQSMIDTAGGFKSLGISETGWPTHKGQGGVTEEVQAAETVRQYILSDAQGILHNTVYDLRNDGIDKENMEHNFGLLREDFMPKKAYYSVKSYQEQLAGMQYYGKVNIGNNIGYVYGKSAVPVVAAWNEIGESGTTIPDGIVARDLYGRGIQAEKLTDEPMYLYGYGKEILVQAAINSAEVQYRAFVDKLADCQSAEMRGILQRTKELSEKILNIGSANEAENAIRQTTELGIALRMNWRENPDGLNGNDVSEALWSLWKASVFMAKIHGTLAGEKTYELQSETDVSTAETYVKSSKAGEKIHAEAMLKQAKESLEEILRLAEYPEYSGYAAGMDLAISGLAKWCEKAVQTDVGADRFQISIDRGKMSIVGNLSTECSKVTIQVLKPDVTPEDLQMKKSIPMMELFEYIGQSDIGENRIFTFSHPMGEQEGVYTARVFTDDGEALFSKNIYYLPDSVRKQLVLQIKSAKSVAAIQQIFEENFSTFSSLSPLFEKGEPEDFACAAEQLFVHREQVQTLEDAIVIVEKALILSVLGKMQNEHQLEELTERYAKILGLSGTEGYQTYQSQLLSGETKKLIMKRMLNAQAESVIMWREIFCRTVLLTAIEKTSYKDVIKILEMNSEAKIICESYYTCNIAERIKVLKRFSGHFYADLVIAQETFRAAVDEVLKERSHSEGTGGRPGGGISSGGGASGGGGSGIQVSGSQPEIAVRPDEADEFHDLYQTLWAKAAIESLAKMEIVNGKGNGIFAPLDLVLREEFLKMLILSMDLTGHMAEQYMPFEDVPENSWFYPYVVTGKALGITRGESERIFGIGKNITRQQMAVMLYRTLKKKNYNLELVDTEAFSDWDSVSTYAREAVLYLQQAGIIQGDEFHQFSPNDSATRAEAALMLYRVLNVCGMRK